MVKRARRWRTRRGSAVGDTEAVRNNKRIFLKEEQTHRWVNINNSFQADAVYEIIWETVCSAAIKMHLNNKASRTWPFAKPLPRADAVQSHLSDGNQSLGGLFSLQQKPICWARRAYGGGGGIKQRVDKTGRHEPHESCERTAAGDFSGGGKLVLTFNHSGVTFPGINYTSRKDRGRQGFPPAEITQLSM